MTAKILDGLVFAKKIREEILADLASPLLRGRKLRLLCLAIGHHPNADLYEKHQRRHCEEVGIEYRLERLPQGTSEEELIQEIQRWNQDPAATGIILQRPLPQGFNARRLQAKIHPDKDVEGMNPANIGMIIYGTPRLAPCTALAAVELAKSSGVPLKGKHAVVVGHSEIVGKPVAFLLLNEFATATICHIETRDLASHTREADLLFVAVGKPNLLRGDMVKPGAIVLDIGINRIMKDGKEITVGDVETSSVREVAGFLSPVPGGVGPVTVAMLLRNTVTARKLFAEKEGS